MPQLEQIDTFVSQIFWLFVTFGFLYLILWKIALPRVADILLERQEKIEEDLRKAEQFKNEADKAIALYETSLANARDEALSLIKDANNKISAEAAIKHESLSKKIKSDMAEAEERIEKARIQALENMQNVAIDVASAATNHLLDKTITRESAQKAVGEAIKETR
tara:strand:- start:534 stop:1028 length:495 start_codon:yes stop_codon:yes gene_type:complete